MILKTLSPVHIGDGESYNRFSFLRKDNKLYFIDAQTIKEVLSPPQIKRLNQWLERESQRLERERNLRLRRFNPSLRIFLNQELKDSSLIGKMASKAKYSISLKGLEGQEPGRVFSFIKSRNKPYIPGTEVKGAFRTALLYRLVMENFYAELEKKLEDFGRKFAQSVELVRDRKLSENRKQVYLTREEFLSISQDELKMLFKEEIPKILRKAKKAQFPPIRDLKGALGKRLQEIEEEIQARAFRPFAQDAKYDLLRLLQIGDSELKSPSDSLTAAPIIFVGLKRSPSEVQNYHEMLKPNQEFRLDLKISDNKFKPNFLQKFSFSPNQKKILENEIALFRCAHEFYSKVLEEEEKYYKEGFNEVVRFLQDIKRQNTPESPVLRLGKHEGFLSLTLGLAIKDKNFELYRDVLVPAIPTKTYSSEDFPKTRKLTRINNKELPLGWVQLRREG